VATGRHKRFEDVFSGVDRIPACDRRTDRQTSCDGIVSAMHTRRAVKTATCRLMLQVLELSTINVIGLA